MPDARVALVEEIARLTDAGGHRASAALFAEHAHADVEWREDPYWPDAATFRGAEEIERVLDERTASVKVLSRTERVEGHGDFVVQLTRWEFAGDASGARGVLRVALLWSFEDGLIRAVDVYLDPEAAIAAARSGQPRSEPPSR